MVGMYGVYGVYGRSGMACLECMVGMVCHEWLVLYGREVWYVSLLGMVCLI